MAGATPFLMPIGHICGDLDALSAQVHARIAQRRDRRLLVSMDTGGEVFALPLGRREAAAILKHWAEQVVGTYDAQSTRAQIREDLRHTGLLLVRGFHTHVQRVAA